MNALRMLSYSDKRPPPALPPTDEQPPALPPRGKQSPPALPPRNKQPPPALPPRTRAIQEQMLHLQPNDAGENGVSIIENMENTYNIYSIKRGPYDRGDASVKVIFRFCNQVMCYIYIVVHQPPRPSKQVSGIVL